MAKRDESKNNQKRRAGVPLISAFLLLAALALAFHAEQAKQNAQAAWQSITICLEMPLTEKEVQSLAAKEQDLAFTVWGELEDQTVQDPKLGRSLRTNVLAVHGSAALALPLARGLPADDEAGCLIGEAASWALFGSTRAEGNTICIGGKEYAIRAVVRVPQDAVVVNGSSLDTGRADYSRITLDSRQEKDGEAFLMRNSLSGRALRLDYLKSAGWLAELVPGKWSDFAGWRQNLERARQDFLYLSQIRKTASELYYESQCRQYRRSLEMELICILLFAGIAFARLPKSIPLPRYGAFLRAGRISCRKDAETDPHGSRADS